MANVVYSMVGHDLEEFRAVVQRHGDWSAAITLFNEAQSDLFAGPIERLKAAGVEGGKLLNEAGKVTSDPDQREIPDASTD